MSPKRDLAAKDNVATAKATDHSWFVEDIVEALKGSSTILMATVVRHLEQICDTRLTSVVVPLKEENTQFVLPRANE